MADLNWKFAKNQFLSATEGRRPLMLTVGSDHVAKLTAKLGSPADPDIQVCLDRVQPLFDAFQLGMVDYDVRSGTRKGQTEVLVDLLEELSGQRIKQWDITVQSVYLAGTPQYTQIFPDGRGPFQTGPQDQRILAVQTLASRLAPFSEFAALKTTVEAFHASLQAARDTQQGTEGEIETASGQAEAARVALAVGLYANVGRLMEKHADDPDRLGDYFEVALLRAGSPSLPAFPFNWQTAGADVELWFQVPDGLSGAANVVLSEGALELTTAVDVPPGATQSVTWTGAAISDEVDEVLLVDAEAEAIARGERDEGLPQPS